jgi:hypothetical protein
MSSGSFIFDMSSSIAFTDISTNYPVINTSGSFSGLSTTSLVSGSIRTLIISWSSVTPTGSDGILFTNVSYRGDRSINIKQFGNACLLAPSQQFGQYLEILQV